LKKKDPNCSIFISAGKKSRGLKSIIKNVDRWFFRSGNINIFTNYKHIKNLKKYKYDKIILIRNAKFTHKIAKSMKTKQVIGVEKPLINNLDITVVNRPQKKNHITDNTKYITNYLGIEHFEYKINFKNLSCNKTNKKYIIFSPGTTRKAKMWPLTKWFHLGEKLNEKHNYKIYIVGSKKDRYLSNDFKKAKFKFTDLIGKTDLKQLYCYLKNAELIVTVDNGTMHLGDLTDTPVISLFGSTDPSIIGPKSENSYVIESPISCKYCGKNKCKNDKFCMEKIDENRVFELLQKLL